MNCSLGAILTTSAAVFSLLLFAGCGSMAPPSVHASTPPPHPIIVAHTIQKNCPAGCVGAESPGVYLALRIGPQFTTDETEFVYTLPYALHVSHIDGWDDNGFGNVQETDTHLQIQFPDGSYTEFWVQYDAHSASLPGEKQREFTTDLDLPPGTKLVMYHNTANCISPVNQCGYDSVWQLRSK
jgi:hypothetical protein